MVLGNRFNIFDSNGRIYHAEVGFAAGSHFDQKHTTDMRLVAGYYSGPDPRAKYAQFLGYNGDFGYLSLMFDL